MVLLEAAIVVPLLVVVALTCLGVARLAVDEVAVASAARDAALQAARGAANNDVAAEVARRVPGAEVFVTPSSLSVEVRVRRAALNLPGLGRPAVVHEAVAVAAREPGMASTGAWSDR